MFTKAPSKNCAITAFQRCPGTADHLIATRTEELKSVREDLQIVFDKMLEGFAIHEMIFDDNDRPKDYRFLRVNPAFELMTGLNGENIVGKSVLEVMPNIDKFWIET